MTEATPLQRKRDGVLERIAGPVPAHMVRK